MIPIPALSPFCSTPLHRYPLEQFERVVSMKVMKLRSQETMTGRKEYVVMGTTYVCGEAVQCLGKVIRCRLFVLVFKLSFGFKQIRIFDVIEVIPEPGKPLTKNKLKVFMLLVCSSLLLCCLYVLA